MSLRVWLPLNGNLNNNGCNPLTPVQTTTPTYVNGKIGKAMSTGAFYLPAAQVAKFYNNNAMSFCFWIYPTTSSSTAVPIIGQSNTAASDCRMFTIYQYPNGVDLHLSWQTETGGNAFLSSILSNAFTVNVWNHCAITYDGSSVKIYVNGTLKQTYTNIVSTRSNFNYNVPIPNASSRYLNDIRIYDHVLSEKEIKEIAKGLVVRYPLNNQYEIGKINKYSDSRAEGDTSWSSFTKTKLANERGYNFKYTYTGNGSNSWPNCGFPTFSFTIGKRHQYSVKVRCHKSKNSTLSLRAARSTNDWVTSSVVVCSETLADGKWHEYNVSQIINETYDRSGTTVTCAPVLEFYCNNMNGNGTVYELDFDMKDVQVVESDNYIPFINNSYASNTIHDSSGYNYNGTSSAVKYLNDSCRNSGSVNFTENASTVTITPFLSSGQTLTEFTATCWFKTNTLNSTAPNIFSLGENSFFRIRISAATSVWYYVRVGTTQCASTYTTKTLTDNVWHHVGITFKNGVIRMYIDGVQVGTTDHSATATYLTCSNVGTTWHLAGYTANSENFIGALSDFRIYTIALSADDIKELYQTSVNITNNGTMFAYEYIEN